jgi:hypothetical protein
LHPEIRLKILSKPLIGWLRLLKALSGQRVHQPVQPGDETQAMPLQDLARQSV